MVAEADILALLEEFGEQLLLDIDTSLKNKGHGRKAQGGASQSTGLIGTGKFKIVPGNGSIALNFYLNDYWYFLEYGRGVTKSAKTKKPFEKTLAGKLYKDGWDIGKGIDAKTWYRRSQLKLYKKSDGKSGSVTPKKHKIYNDYEGLRKLLAHAIARKIHQKGFKGSKFLSNVLEDGRFETLSKRLSEIIGKEIVIDISNAFKQ